MKDATQRVSKEVVELFGKAAELFIAELALASWTNVAPAKKIIQVNDIAIAVASYHTYDFLKGIVPEPVTKAKRVVRIPSFIYNSTPNFLPKYLPKNPPTTTKTKTKTPVRPQRRRASTTAGPSSDPDSLSPQTTMMGLDDHSAPLHSSSMHSGEQGAMQMAHDLPSDPIAFPSEIYQLPVQSPLASMPAESRAHFSTMTIEAATPGAHEM